MKGGSTSNEISQAGCGFKLVLGKMEVFPDHLWLQQIRPGHRVYLGWTQYVCSLMILVQEYCNWKIWFKGQTFRWWNSVQKRNVLHIYNYLSWLKVLYIISAIKIAGLYFTALYWTGAGDSVHLLYRIIRRILLFVLHFTCFIMYYNTSFCHWEIVIREVWMESLM